VTPAAVCPGVTPARVSRGGGGGSPRQERALAGRRGTHGAARSGTLLTEREPNANRMGLAPRLHLGSLNRVNRPARGGRAAGAEERGTPCEDR
jgi:hypothetical protein